MKPLALIFTLLLLFRLLFRFRLFLRLFFGLRAHVETRKLFIRSIDQVAPAITGIAVVQFDVIPEVSVPGLDDIEDLDFVALVQTSDNARVRGRVISDHDAVSRGSCRKSSDLSPRHADRDHRGCSRCHNCFFEITVPSFHGDLQSDMLPLQTIS